MSFPLYNLCFLLTVGWCRFEEFVQIIQLTKIRVMRRKAAKAATKDAVDETYAKTAAKRMLEKYKAVFDRFDVDGSGSITGKELKVMDTQYCVQALTIGVQDVLVSIGKNPSDEGVIALVKAADLNCDGQIDFEEFVSLMQQQMIPKKAANIGKAMAEAAVMWDKEDREKRKK